MKDVEKGQESEPLPPKKKRAFFLPSNTFRAIKFTELEQCCCADVPCLSIIKEYCESSSLHGLKYISEDGRHWTERVLWFIMCLMGFILTIYFIIPIWIKWNSHVSFKQIKCYLQLHSFFVAYVDYTGFDKSPCVGNRFSRRDNLLTKQSSSSKIGKYCQKFAY